MRTPALGLIGGTVADWLVGDPRRGHPVAGFGRVAAALEARMWRPSRVAGAAYTLLLVGGTAGAAAWADRRLRRRPGGRAVLLGAVTWAAVGGRSLAAAGRDLGEAVRSGDLDRARTLAPTLVGRDPSRLDGPQLCRAAVESVAENTADAVIGPLVWGSGRPGRGGRLPGREHPGRHGRPQEPQVPALRLGRGPARRPGRLAGFAAGGGTGLPAGPSGRR